MRDWFRKVGLVLGCAGFLSAGLPVLGDAPPDFLTAQDPPAHAVWLDSLSMGAILTMGNAPKPGKSVWGHPIDLTGVDYVHGVAMQGVSEMNINLHGDATQFQSVVGIDNEVTHDGAVDFSVLVDGKTVFDSGKMVGQQAPQFVTVDLTGAKTLTLHVVDSRPDDSYGDNADWAGAIIRLAPDATIQPAAVTLPQIGEYPVWDAEDAQPQIHGPRTVGASPNRPFLFLIPASGRAPLHYTATDLPPGLTLDPTTGILSGKITAPGTFSTHITVSNDAGRATETLTVICGPNKLAQTPPMGWTSLGIDGDAVTDAQVRAAADNLVASGLAAHGYRYVVLGDSWEGARDASGALHPNSRFPDMKALADYIHSKGLLFGLSSSSTAQTCSGFVGSLGHEKQDAETFAGWGVDYLAYDWCPTPVMNVVADTTMNLKPKETSKEVQVGFAAMGDALAQTNRDMVYAVNLTVPAQNSWNLPYMNPDPSTWAAKVGANSLVTDSGIYENLRQLVPFTVTRTQDATNNGVGHWGGFGLLAVGRSGYPAPRWTRLTPSEQMTQMSLWCLFSTPLFVSCDLAQLNPNLLSHETTAVLTNDEALAVDQDPLAAPPTLLNNAFGQSSWMKPLTDGRVAVVVVNNTDQTHQDQIAWSDLKLAGSQPVRDLWKHQDLGEFAETFEADVPANGVLFLTVGHSHAASEATP
jgi:alpha-galactosidase